MSSRAHARRRLAAWDRYLRSYGAFSGRLFLGRADCKWWLRVRRVRARGGRRR